MSSSLTPPASKTSPKVAFVLSRFPKISETFILYEILALERLGLATEIYALRRERQAVAHPEARAMTQRVHFRALLSPGVIVANAHFLFRHPRTYLATLSEVLRGTFGSRKQFLAALAYFPKSACFAYDMRRRGITHIHAHFATHPTLVALVAHRLIGLPFSFTAHGSDLHVDRRMLAEKLSAAEFAVTCSEFNRDLMIEDAAADPRTTHVIHYGVDLDIFRPGDVPEEVDLGTISAPCRIICVASFEEVKGHRFLVDACERMAKSGVSFHVDLVGDGPTHAEVESSVEAAGLSPRFTFHGMQTRDAVAAMLQEADIKVLASYPSADGKREGMPNVIIEAMASGLPVVATRLTGIPELVEDGVTGLLVPPGESVALADALERLCADRELRVAMGVAGRNKAVGEYDRTTNARQLGSLFGLQTAAVRRDANSSGA